MMRRLLALLVCAATMVAGQTSLYVTKEITAGTYTKMVTTTCTSQGKHYYNTATQSCGTCSTNQEADTSILDALGDPVGCKCSAGFKKVAANCYGTSTGACVGFDCQACVSQAALRDQSSCLPCANGVTGTTSSTTATTCSCTDPQAQYLAETSTAITCEVCPARQRVVTSSQTIAGKYYYANKYSCQSCPDEAMTMSYASSTYACTCDNDYTKLGVEAIGHQSCVHTTKAAPYLAIESTATQVTYSTGTIVSQTFLHYFTKAAANCAYYGSSLNVLDCQVLANLCVLQLYYDQSGACKSFNAIVALRGTSYTESVINWGTGMPWLYYSGGNTACSDTGYRPYVSLKNYVMNYAVAQYSMNGTFFGFTQLSTLLTYCTRRAPHTGKGGGSSSSTGWNKFGATEQSKFACDLDTLTAANGKQQMFYELYLYDNQYVDLYYPVPVRIVNLKSGDVTVNSLSPKAPCGGNDILVRRFFLFDIVSGLTSASATVPQVMRFASDITLEVQISDNFRKIKAPILTIQYQESIPATWAAYIPTNDEGSIGGPQTVNYYFQARYSMNMDSFSSTLFGFFIAVVVFCGLCFLFRLNNWNVRMSRMVKQGYNMSNGINLRSMFEFTLLSTSSWVYFFFPVHLITCWYFFAFFKLQSVPATLLPPMNNIYSTSSPYFVFVANLHIMAFFQLFYCITLIYRQATADIFFLDWQPPSAPTGGGKGQPQTAGKVSVWRTLFVANEWAELQTKRKTDVAFSLFWIGFFLLGLGLEYNATQQPDLTNQSMGTLNVVLRFANTSWWWFVMSLFQFFWKFLFWERFIDESPEQQFIDFCTIAKVSILVLDEPYHGYYLHCRSPHQNADSSMAELVEMLHKEEAGLTVDRSLEGGPKDVQTFRIFMSGEWRARFNNIYSKLAKTESAFEMFTQGRSARRANGGATPLARLGGAGDGSINDSKNSTTAWLRVSSFLQEFVENSLNTPGLRRIIREATYFERFAGVAPEMASPDQPCVFLPDRYFEYSRMLFYGRETDLLLMNVLAYSLFDLWFSNTAISILLTYLLDFLFCFMRQRLGLANIANKTLIDSRFLI